MSLRNLREGTPFTVCLNVSDLKVPPQTLRASSVFRFRGVGVDGERTDALDGLDKIGVSGSTEQTVYLYCVGRTGRRNEQQSIFTLLHTLSPSTNL